MEKTKYDMLLEEIWDIMWKEHGGEDIKLAVKIRSPYERIGTVTEILRNAAEKSSLSRFNGALYCFTGQIYEMVSWRDVKNVVYDLMQRMECPMADFQKKDAVVRGFRRVFSSVLA